MPRRSSGCGLIFGGVEGAEADLELVVAQWWLQRRGDELLAVAPSARNRSNRVSRPTLFNLAAVAGCST